jgi:hypothetical protein
MIGEMTMAIEMKQTLNQNAANPFKHSAGLSAVWQKCMSEVYESDFRSLIRKEHGQLGKLRKSLGTKLATEVVEYAIQNWGKFARKAATSVGSDVFPEKPSVGWLFKYQATALLMLQGELQSKQQAQEAQAKKQAQAKEAAKVALQVAAHNAEREKPATLEEMDAIEAELEAEWAAKETLSA